MKFLTSQRPLWESSRAEQIFSYGRWGCQTGQARPGQVRSGQVRSGHKVAMTLKTYSVNTGNKKCT